VNVIYLSGESIRNKTWIYELQTQLSPLFNKTVVLEYSHWSTDSTDINLETELEKLASITQNNKDYIIIAKSIGSVLATEAISKKLAHPIKCIFLGVPVNVIEKYNYHFANYLESIQCPVLFIQNKNDPTGKCDQLVDLLNSANIPNLQYNVLELPGDKHDYVDYQTLYQLTKVFIEP
jgi:predicted alpha/beta-hydrolase family hydrolase